ncbi:uncharacterized protein RJT20DRAFT_125153 [Scheffersomyces xylosifermentans]|uniref:uncharacterized protein n=1 Tax=Scheffersomyces xylosifermentans TaxID=1304137 RepID=UPI00315CD4F8
MSFFRIWKRRLPWAFITKNRLLHTPRSRVYATNWGSNFINITRRASYYTETGIVVPNKSFSGTSQLKNPVFDSFIQQKSLDRVHRTLYKSLERERNKYNKHHTTIKPSIRHLLVLLQSEFYSTHSKNELTQHLSPQIKSNRLLEPIVFHIILSLHYITNPNVLEDTYIHSQTTKQVNYLTDVYNRLLPRSKDINTKSVHYSNEIVESAALLVEQFSEPNQDLKATKSLHLSIACFNELSKKFKSKPLLEEDLIKWIRSLIATSVTSSCDALTNLTDIPAFVLADVLLRTPMSKEEFRLQLDIWTSYIRHISVAYVDKPSHLKHCINNLIFYCIQYEPSKLLELIQSTFSFYSNPKSGVKVPIIVSHYLNELIWSLAEMYLKGPPNKSPTSMTGIITSQELLVKYLSQTGDSKEKTSSKLSLRSFMGIVLAINTKSTEKGTQLFEIAQKKFFSGEHEISSKDMVSYNVTRIYLSKTPEELLHHFNNAATTYFHSAILWFSFISKLNEFNLLNAKRSKNVLNELIRNSDRIIITKDIVSALLVPVSNLKQFDDFIDVMLSKDEKLVTLHNSVLLPKYISMLYRSSKKDLVETYYPWDKDLLKGRTERISSQSQFKGFESPVHYARYLYSNGFKKKSIRLIGLMLEGEAEIDSKDLFETYKRELSANGDLSPNGSCLLALIKGAMYSNEEGTCNLWGDLYATQVVIHEFKSNVQLDSSDVEFKIYPENKLWRRYIQMLGKYNYVSELSDIIKWWEALKFTPSRNTLMELLAALPEEYSYRYIQHFAKIKEDSQRTGGEIEGITSWPWPSVSELRSY